jgi:hypothetical protein
VKHGVQVDPGVIVHSKAEEDAWLAANTEKEAEEANVELFKGKRGQR